MATLDVYVSGKENVLSCLSYYPWYHVCQVFFFFSDLCLVVTVSSQVRPFSDTNSMKSPLPAIADNQAYRIIETLLIIISSSENTYVTHLIFGLSATRTRILPVHVEAIKAMLANASNGAGNEAPPLGGIRCHLSCIVERTEKK